MILTKSPASLFLMNRIKLLLKIKLPECLVDMLSVEIAWLSSSEVLFQANFTKSYVHHTNLMEKDVKTNGTLHSAEKLVCSQLNKLMSFRQVWVKIGSYKLPSNVPTAKKICIKEIYRRIEWDVQGVNMEISVHSAVKSGLVKITIFVEMKAVG